MTDREKLFTVTTSDCKFSYFTAGGKGGQNQNKVASACRVTHPPSGAVGESREYRHQLENKRAAWKRMVEHPKMKPWIQMESSRLLGIEDKINKTVDEAMLHKNLKIEIKNTDGLWIEDNSEQVP